jgi:hypothetical protein
MLDMLGDEDVGDLTSGVECVCEQSGTIDQVGGRGPSATPPTQFPDGYDARVGSTGQNPFGS